MTSHVVQNHRSRDRGAEVAVVARSDEAPSAFRVAMAGLIALLTAVAVMLSAAQARAQAAPPSFADLVDQVGDSVVNITTSAIVAGREGPMPDMPPGSPLEDFFNDFLDRQQGPER
ncbi:MAG: hypothetical protein ACOCTP_04335, partial [Roseicyclus sp.]